MDSATLPDDELALPHFEQRLLAELVAQQRAGTWSAPQRLTSAGSNGVRPDDAPMTDLGALDHGAPTRPRRRRRLALAGVVGVAAAVAAAAFVVAGDGDDKADVGTQEEPPTTEAPVVVSGIEADILAATETAFATTVVHAKPSDGMESWSDEQSKAMRTVNPQSAAPQLLDRGRSVPPSPDEVGSFDQPAPMRTVDYCLRQWADTNDPLLWMGTGLGLDGIVSGLRDGILHVEGTEVVDGRELLRVVGITTVDDLPADVRQRLADAGIDLTINEDGSVGYDAEGLTQEEDAQLAELFAEVSMLTDSSTYYVDPATNLPVLVRAPSGTTTTVEFLPRTPESLALLVPPIPEGFTQVDKTALDDERYSRGCL